MKHSTKAVLKRAGLSALCMTVVASCVLPFMGNKSAVELSEAEIQRAEALSTLRDYSKEIVVTKAQKEESLKLVSFISSNLDKMREEYANYAHEDFYGTYVEHWAVADVVGEKGFATYIDFDDNNGYMVVDNNFKLYDFQVSGDKDYLKDNEVVVFSTQSGFVHYDSSERGLVAYEEPVRSQTQSTNAPSEVEIIPLSALEDHVNIYYEGYTLSNRFVIEDYHHVISKDLSVFYYSTTRYENNDVLAAAYAVANSWGESGIHPELLARDHVESYDASTRETYYQETLNWGWKVNTGKISNPQAYMPQHEILRFLPIMYGKIRKEAFDYDYHPYRGYSTWDNGEIALFRAARSRGVELALKTYGESYVYPLQIMVVNHGAQVLTYRYDNSDSDHVMPIYGYREYSKEKGWWIFSKTDYAYFAEVDKMSNAADVANEFFYDLQTEGVKSKIIFEDSVYGN